MSSLTSRAKVATAKFVNHEFDALLLADGSMLVGISQIAELFSVPQKNTSRDFKALLGNGSQFLKVSSELNSKAVNAVTLEQFELILVKLAIAGNVKAQEWVTDLVGRSLIQIVSDAFGVKFEKEERQLWDKTRVQGKKERLSWTDSIKCYPGV